MELYRKMGPYWITRDDDGNYYKVGNRALITGFKMMTEDRLVEGLGSKAVITFAMIVSMFKASGQNTEKVKDIVKNSSKEVIMTQEQLQQLNKATGIEWGEELANNIFIFSPDEPKSKPREIPELDLGAYGGDLHVAKISNKNHKVNGDIEYTVDISDKRYLRSKIFKSIREFNSELKGVEINFTYRGAQLPGKLIKL